jgi:hypothetical protein
MNCQEFWNALPQLAPPQLAPAAWENHEHLAHCPACAARLRSQLALQKGLRAVASQMNGMGAPPCPSRIAGGRLAVHWGACPVDAG